MQQQQQHAAAAACSRSMQQQQQQHKAAYSSSSSMQQQQHAAAACSSSSSSSMQQQQQQWLRQQKLYQEWQQKQKWQLPRKMTESTRWKPQLDEIKAVGRRFPSSNQLFKKSIAVNLSAKRWVSTFSWRQSNCRSLEIVSLAGLFSTPTGVLAAMSETVLMLG